MITFDDKVAESIKITAEAAGVFGNPDATGEEKAEAHAKVAAAMAMKADAEAMGQISSLSAQLAAMATNAPIVDSADPVRPRGYKSFGELLIGVHNATHFGRSDPRLKIWGGDKGEKDEGAHTNKDGWLGGSGQKDLIESIGASGGFLVPTEYRNQLQMYDSDSLVVRPARRLSRCADDQSRCPCSIRLVERQTSRGGLVD